MAIHKDKFQDYMRLCFCQELSFLCSRAGNCWCLRQKSCLSHFTPSCVTQEIILSILILDLCFLYVPHDGQTIWVLCFEWATTRGVARSRLAYQSTAGGGYRVPTLKILPRSARYFRLSCESCIFTNYPWCTNLKMESHIFLSVSFVAPVFFCNCTFLCSMDLFNSIQ